MKTKGKIAGYLIRSGVLAVLLLSALVALVSAFDLAITSPTSSLQSASSPERASTNLGDVAVNIGNSRIKKLSAADGTVLWSVAVVNDSALAVDPIDLGVYTGHGSHNFGDAGTVYKYAANGSLAWTNSITVSGICNFYYVSYAAVDTTSANYGVVWTQSGCYGGVAKTRRDTGAQRWSVLTNDIGRASIDPVNGRIYDVTNAGPEYNYDTLYSVSADGTTVNPFSSCEGYTDLNPADGMLYRGGDTRSSGCGLILSQTDKSNPGSTNWSLDLSSHITSFDALAVQPWSGGHIYVASASSSKIVVVNPATHTVVRTFLTTVAPNYIAVNPINGNVYITDGSSHFVYAYSPTGRLVWTSPDLGGAAGSVAAPRVVAPPCSAPAVTTNAVSNIASNSATLHGTVNPNGCNTTVHFQYGTTTSYGFTTANQTFTGNTTHSVSANIAGLSANTTYHFRTLATNSSGTTYGSDRIFTTLSATGAPEVTTNPATNVASFSATLNGTVDPHRLTTTVYFQYGMTTGYGSTTSSQTKSGSTYERVSANIGGLAAHTTYHFRLVASNSSGTRYGSDRTFTTLSATGPPVVTSNQATNVAGFQLHLMVQLIHTD